MEFETNAYLRRLMITDHIREINIMYDRYKSKEITWDDMRRELMDLKILLNAEFLTYRYPDDRELYFVRKERFEEKEADHGQT